MEWSEQGVILSLRKHGETSVIVTIITEKQGVHAGLVRGGSGIRKLGDLQPGNLVQAHWRGRLAEHLGNFNFELIRAHAANLFRRPDSLSCLSSALAISQSALPEREAQPKIFNGLNILLNSLEGKDWPSIYVKWELGLLSALGFGLDFSCCAASGVISNLVYVSPKSGCAVSGEAGEPYKKSLLSLPQFLLEHGVSGTPNEIVEGLNLTGFFLERHVFNHLHSKKLPAARYRFCERMRKLRI